MVFNNHYSSSKSSSISLTDVSSAKQVKFIADNFKAFQPKPSQLVPESQVIQCEIRRIRRNFRQDLNKYRSNIDKALSEFDTKAATITRVSELDQLENWCSQHTSTPGILGIIKVYSYHFPNTEEVSGYCEVWEDLGRYRPKRLLLSYPSKPLNNHHPPQHHHHQRRSTENRVATNTRASGSKRSGGGQSGGGGSGDDDDSDPEPPSHAVTPPYQLSLSSPSCRRTEFGIYFQYLTSLIIFMLSIAWLIQDQSFEPLILAFATCGAIVAQILKLWDHFESY